MRNRAWLGAVDYGRSWQGNDGRLNASIAGYPIEQEGFGVLDRSRLVIEGGQSYIVDNAGNRYPDSVVRTGVSCCYITGFDIALTSRGIETEFSGEIVQGWAGLGQLLL
ncbi:hypothetical protein ACFPN2_08435 [Steroidobacter flavus]|uniref:Uncharacterized protein n=1 Tax=Steroidobacter flavus TaxID=1842136 RepID=A0ABV8SNF8_9GAMM